MSLWRKNKESDTPSIVVLTVRGQEEDLPKFSYSLGPGADVVGRAESCSIQIADPQISRQQAINAAKAVAADQFIEALPLGYDTLLVERGQNLSQGERQLLAFARVLAADPEILILDEATASIDTDTEQIIQKALRKIMHGRTSILIAHRLQTIEEADRILVLKHGRVKELGTHAQLMALKGVYYTLNQLQFQNVSLNPGDAD